MVTFSIGDTGDSDSNPVPVPTGGALEGETGYTCTGGATVTSSWSTTRRSSSSSSGASPASAAPRGARSRRPCGISPSTTRLRAAVPAVRAPMPRAWRSCPASSASARRRPVSIKHALRFILPNAQIRSGSAWTAPASHGTSSTSSSSGPAYGMRLRLHASFDASTISSPGGKAVVQALKTYGMLLADGGDDIFTAESDYLEQKIDGTTWGTTLQSNDLASIPAFGLRRPRLHDAARFRRRLQAELVLLDARPPGLAHFRIVLITVRACLRRCSVALRAPPG